MTMTSIKKDDEVGLVLDGHHFKRFMCGWYLSISFLVIGCSLAIPCLLYQNHKLSTKVQDITLQIETIKVILEDMIDLDEEFVEHGLTRKKRQVYDPVMPTSTPSEGLRLYEEWQTSGQKKEPISAEITVEDEVNTSNLSDTSFSPELYYTKRPIRFVHQNFHSKPIIARKGRVQQTDENEFQNIVRPATAIPTWEQIKNYEGSTLRPEITHQEEFGKPSRRKRKKQKRRPIKKQLVFGPQDYLDNNDLAFNSFEPLSAALYYANANMTRHTNHYLGNHRVKNKGRKFLHFKHVSWMNKLGMTGYYKLHRGDITVNQAGLYFVFAQVQYSDMRDLNGFEIDVNNEFVTNCIAMTTTTPGNLVKSNTCFTATVVYLHSSDRIGLRDLEHHRISLQKEGHTYIGLIQLM